jgi:uncharacterized protein YggE
VVDQRTLVVGGSGVVSGTPDQCVLNLSFNGIGTTPAETLDVCSAAAKGAIDAAVGEGINQDDVRTVNLTVQDHFDQAKQKITARIGSYQLEVVVRNLDDVGRILGVLSEAAGEIRSLQLGLKNVDPVRKAARREAVRDAQEKAQDLAEAAGLQLGDILTLEDNERSRPQAGRTLAMASVKPTASVPVEPGHVSIAVSVTITYAILPN